MQLHFLATRTQQIRDGLRNENVRGVTGAVGLELWEEGRERDADAGVTQWTVQAETMGTDKITKGREPGGNLHF